MVIPITKEDELLDLFEILGKEILLGNCLNILKSNLDCSVRRDQSVFNVCPTFWIFTLAALEEERTSCLCRVLDPNKKVLSLFNLLETIRANRDMFRKRAMFSNGGGDLEKVDVGSSWDEQLRIDLASVSLDNCRVKRLMIWRNNVHSHMNADVCLGKLCISEEHPLYKGEIEALLVVCLAIFNRYACVFGKNVDPKKRSDLEDYKTLLTSARSGSVGLVALSRQGV